MIYLKTPCSFSGSMPDLKKALPGDGLFFDIETTGLSHRASHVYLIGCAALDPEDATGSGWILHQWLLKHPAAEKELLSAFSEFLKKQSGRLIHYNGSTFDIPYLQSKYKQFGLSDPFSGTSGPDFDLYRAVRPYQETIGIKRLRLRDVEEFCGIIRSDPYSGAELTERYRIWLGTGSKIIQDELLAHNRDDILGLMHLYPLRIFGDLTSGAFRITGLSWSGDASSPTFDSAGTLHIRIETDFSSPVPLTRRRNGFSLVLEGNKAVLEVNASAGTRKLFLPDYENYYYLPEEDCAIHKSVGAFVDSSFRKRATARTCYQKKDGLFLPQDPVRFRPALYTGYHSHPAWFLIPDPPELPFPDPAAPELRLWAADLIRALLKL